VVHFNGAFAPSNAIMTNMFIVHFRVEVQSGPDRAGSDKKVDVYHFLHLTQGHVQMLCDICTEAF
jgi:hypothetical protein